MKQFFMEFVFEGPLGSVYWFPLRIRTNDREQAAAVMTRFQNGIAGKYLIRNSCGPIEDSGSVSTFLAAHCKSNARFQLRALDVNEYKLRTVKYDEQLTFEDHFELEMMNAKEVLPGDNEVLAKVKHRKFPVRVMEEGDIGKVPEILVINVIVSS